MDDILRRMLDVEKRAEDTVAAAAAEADRILAEGAAEVAALRAAHADETDRLVREHLETRRADAEREKAGALEAAAARIESRAAVLGEQLAGRASQVVPLLAYGAGGASDA